ncbi:DNA cytosine methyltransferase [Nocardiopsis lambiniae]|uniref:DNA (cytosine-5-)-methyltransferase n=1 Tax=Nocardiopsis lambiniae TaxID=3075539 RepID=A0ABU2MBS7_9ACTN|nr:DNA cytosine methyltransferase [Nocardiopsis sp. DSM 44743]MDT0330135.1 DNA cytosine methyltransferase [Nocardiopsis sp. DSM 44743]
MSSDDTFTVLDLFAGCGGLSTGFHAFVPEGGGERAFRAVGAVEMDLAAASTYAVNTGLDSARVHAGRIEDWDPAAIPERVDLILGGPPCQGFSSLNHKNRRPVGSDDVRNRLWREYARAVRVLEPRAFIIENVDRFFRSPEFALLKAATEDPDGELRDYVLTAERVVNAADHGVPQARRRAILLATHRDLVSSHPSGRGLVYPDPTHAKAPGAGSLAPWVSAATVFDRTPAGTSTTVLPDRVCAPLGARIRGPFTMAELHVGRNPTARSLLRYARIPPGGNRWDLPPELSTRGWLRHRGGSGDVMGRMHRDRPSVTIRTEFYKPEKGRYLHPTEHRPITHLEAARIQGFPEDFLWCGSKTQIARQIGNAVPVGLAAALAGSVYAYLTGAPVPATG